MRTSKIQVLTVDDQTLFRKGTVMILNSFPEVGDVYEAGNGKEALAFLKEQVVDIVLLDLDMPVMDGREAARKILAKYPGIRIIVLSMVDSLQEISEMIEIGVHSYLIKSLEPEEVRKAINSVINNDFYYNNLVAKALHHKVKNAAMEKPGAYVSSS
ncbi:MAG: response regulator transcription factor, partial [Cyclobacteriaceae bacterium]|nr:response regulator transcription factor [Cyclobacteriaceae bacterium]